jgi:hypothetical protein
VYQLRRLRLHGIGAPDCRFDPLCIDFTDGSRPVDTVLWLRNGGGKTALLSLVFALLHPRRQDFLGHARSHKSLEDHVLSGDTSHVVAEWQLGGGSSRLCTGMVLEWPARQRTRDHADCRRAWYLFRPRARLGLDDLPITDDQGRARSRAAFLDELRGAGRADVELRLGIAEQQQDWRTMLTAAGLDPEMFRYQVRMNADEGAAEEFLAALRTARSAPGDAFVDFVLSLVAPPERIDAVARNVGVASSGLRERPALALERQFLNDVLPLLGGIVDLAAARATARAEHAAAVREATLFLAQLHRGVETSRAEVDRLHRDAESRAAEASAADGQRIAHDNRARELRWRATQLTVKECDEALRSAGEAAVAAQRHREAWSHVPAVVEQRHVREKIGRLELELRAEEHAAQPLRAELSAAGTVLVTALAGAEAALRQAADVAVAAAAAARDRAAELRDEADHNRQDSGRCEQRATECRERVAQLETELVAAVKRGDMQAGDAVRSATSRAAGAVAQARETADELAVRGAAIAQAITALDTDAAHQSEALRVEEHRLDELTTSCASVDERAARLARDPRLLDLAEAREFDVWHSGAELRHRLAEVVGEAEEAVIGAAAAAVDEERLLRAVADHGFLPATRDVDEAVRRLRAAGFNAWPGWEWIARAVRPERQRQVVASRPEVAAGVVVDTAGDSGRAAGVIDGLQPLSLVLLADLSGLDGLEYGAEPADAIALAAHPGLHDAAEARVEAARRERDRRQREEQIRRRRLILAGDRRLADVLGGFLDEWPRDRVDSLRAERTRQAAAVDTLAAEVSRHALRRAELVDEAAEVAGFEREARTRVTDLALRHERLQALAVRADALDGLRSDLDVAVERARELAAAAERASVAAAAAVEEDHRQRATAERLRDESMALARERVSVEYAGDASPSRVVGLDEARRMYAHLLDRYTREVTAGEVAMELRLRREELSGIEVRLGAVEVPVRGLAETLASSPLAATAELRREALRSAERAAQEAAELLGARKATLEAAVTAERKERPSDRERYASLDVAPSTAEEAASLAEQAAAAASEARGRAEEHRKAASEATTHASSMATRAEILELQGRRLRDRIGGEVEVGELTTEPYADTPDAASVVIDALLVQLAAQQEALEACEEELRKSTVQLAKRATIQEYQTLNAAARHRCADADAGQWADTRAAQIHAELQRRAPFVDRTLEQLQEDRRRVVVELGQLVRAGFQYLRQAETSSTLPDGLGEWSAKRFLRIGADEPHDDAQLHDRLEPVIDAAVEDENALLDGMALFLQAMRRANRRAGGFTVTILKPDAVLRPDRVDVEEMQTFSGGQKLTAAVLIYCTVARLRARIRGQGAGGVGVLLLDNPIGKASHLQLIDLQRRVAHALGAQLVFTTAVRDVDALNLFPNRIRLRNALDRGRSRTHVVGEDGAGRVTAVRVARVDESPMLPLETP